MREEDVGSVDEEDRRRKVARSESSTQYKLGTLIYVKSLALCAVAATACGDLNFVKKLKHLFKTVIRATKLQSFHYKSTFLPCYCALDFNEFACEKLNPLINCTLYYLTHS